MSNDCKNWMERMEHDLELPLGVRKIMERNFFRVELLAALEREPVGSMTARKLRQLAMGVWLDTVNGGVLGDDGQLRCHVSNGEFQVDSTLDESQFFIRQAIIRHIERWVVADENGLLNRRWDSVLDVGAGGLALEALIRERSPSARIMALEPGLVTRKTQNVADALRVELRREELKNLEGSEAFDLVVLHFVLEHDKADALEILTLAMQRLKGGGCISIAVPNYHAKHRQMDVEQGLHGRDAQTRLSFHDRLSGHQLIFSTGEMEELIQQAMRRSGLDFSYEIRTILPRESAFNVMCAKGQHRDLLEMHKKAPESEEEGQGSVILAKVLG